MKRFGFILCLAITFLPVAPPAASAAEPARPKSLIEWGWDEPNTKFMRENIAQMEQSPFDGVVFHADISKGGPMFWEMWGTRKFNLDEFQHAIEDLRATKFQRFTELFLRINVTPGGTDWFDDQAWATVAHNGGIAAQIAKQGKCRGFMFDTEQYEKQLFDYAQQPHRNSKTFADYGKQVRLRGKQWITEVNRHYPEITILLTFGYYTAHREKGKDRSQSDYGLLADFLDGVLEGCSDQTKLVDGWEFSYAYYTRPQFEDAYRTIKTESLEWTAVKDKYARQVDAGFGLWMDYNWRKEGWDVNDFSKNHFTPAQFESSLRAALSVADQYVWLYTEQPLWWTRQRLPQAYIDAVVKARSAQPGSATTGTAAPAKK